MKTSLYSKMALTNLKKNRRIYIPRILCEAGLLGCLYIVLTLSMDDRLSKIEGGSYIPEMMVIATVVIGLLSAILMFYTNSFLMKQRKREFGVYNILGMEKKHVGKVLFWESFISTVLALALGLTFGMLFYKAASLLICRLLQTKVVAGFYYLDTYTVFIVPAFFIAIDLVTYIANKMSIRMMKPIELLSSAHQGEQEPKVKWLLLLIGIATLGTGYYLAVSIQSPLKALTYFFVAVFLVIIGTYCLFVTGITFILKVLKRNKKYYYNKNHMPAVSGLLYRMKQNSVGLASICILATGVLIMISTTVSLYSGMQETLEKSYPYQLYLYARYDSCEGDIENEDGDQRPIYVNVPADTLEEYIRKAADKYDVEIETIDKQKYLNISFLFRGNELLTKSEVVGGWDPDELSSVCFVTEADYFELTGETLGLNTGEIAFCTISTSWRNISEVETLKVAGNEYKIKTYLASFPIASSVSNLAGSYGIVVADENVLDTIYQHNLISYGVNASEYTERVAVRYKNEAMASRYGSEMQQDIYDYVRAYIEEQKHNPNLAMWSYLDSKWDAQEDYLGLYGNFLFLGILLGMVCLFATVLIIYYKQVSEGYEDRAKFQIMEKIGMSSGEVKKTIKTQLLMTFFLPLVVAAIHVCFAFPMLTKLLHILLLSSTSLFALCAVITFIVFSIVYIIIYSMTARTYYKIVH